MSLPGLPRPRTLLFVGALFVWFNSGVEAFRLGQWGPIAEQPARILWPPWQPLRAYVSRESDERLYFEYTRLILGEHADLRYIAAKQQGNADENLRRLLPQIRPGDGLRLPYRDFPMEYPPLVLAAIVPPRLLASTLAGYRVAYGAWMSVLFLLAAWLAALLAATLSRADPPPPAEADAAWRRMGWLGLAIGPILCSRFDLLPAVLVAAALLALARGRDWAAGALLGAAAMAKLYPALLGVPIGALLWSQGQRGRVLKIGAAALLCGAALAAPFLLAAPEPFLRSVALYGARPFQIESLAGGALLAIHGGSTVVGSFGSYNAQTPPLLAQAADGLFWLLLAGLGVAAWRSGARLRASSARDEERVRQLVLWSLAGVAVILCASKVLSPQFVIWLVPLPVVLAAAGETRLFRVTLVACALTQAFYPFLYDPLLEGQPLVVLILLARNVALVVLAVLAVRAAAGFAAPSPARASWT